MTKLYFVGFVEQYYLKVVTTKTFNLINFFYLREKKTKPDICKIIFSNTEKEAFLVSEEPKDTQREQQHKIKSECILCGRTLPRKNFQSHEKSFRPKTNIKTQSPNLTQGTSSSQRVSNNNNRKFFDFCIIWITI